MEQTAKHRGRPKDEELATRRREEILDVAVRLFAAQGYHAADVQVVADELHVGKGTIYRYFPSKRALFLAAADRGIQRLTDYIDASMNSPDPLTRLEQTVRAYLGYFQDHPELAELLVQERAAFKDRPKLTYFQHRDADCRRFQAQWDALVAAGRLRDIPFSIVDNVIGDLLYGTVLTNYFAGRNRSPDEQAHEILEIVLGGVLTDAERARRSARPPARGGGDCDANLDHGSEPQR